MKDRSAQGLTVTPVDFKENTSGYHAVDTKVLVKKDNVERTTESGIVFTEEVADKESWTVMTGVIVDHGDKAFVRVKSFQGDEEDWSPKPEVGDRVLFGQYAGSNFIGKDGERYMVFTDKDIIAVEES